MDMTRILKGVLAAGLVLALVALAGCAGDTVIESDVTKAVAVLQATSGNDVTGVVTFTRTDQGIKVVADVEGLAAGKHGFHIHEFGDARAADGTSMGGHFAPFEMPHGAPSDAQRHVGDLGNLEAGEDGTAHLEWVDTRIAFEGPASILGRGVIVHMGEDDLTSQPTGAAGARVAMGVIGVAAVEADEE